MKDLDDAAMAYVYVMSIIALVVAGVVFAFINVFLNNIIVEMNNQVIQGHVSAQTLDYFNLGLGIFQGIPGIFVIGVLVYIVHEAFKRKRGNLE